MGGRRMTKTTEEIEENIETLIEELPTLINKHYPKRMTFKRHEVLEWTKQILIGVKKGIDAVKIRR